MTTKTVSLIPTWGAAVSICIMCLENPEASEEGKAAARSELHRLAAYVDNLTDEENDHE